MSIVAGTRGSVFDDFSWWNEGDVLTQITPARFAYIRSVAGPLDGAATLDVGCGGGMLSEPLARAGARVTGVDVSANAIREAREHGARNGLCIDYVQAQAQQLPFQDGSFSLVIAFDSLEHFDDLALAVKEIARVLAPGGRLVYDTMNRTLVSRVAVIWIGEHLWPGGPPRGTHEWSKLIKPEELVRLLSRNGIANVETRGFVPFGVDLRGRLQMRLLPYKGISYVGYGVKSR